MAWFVFFINIPLYPNIACRVVVVVVVIVVVPLLYVVFI